MAVWALLLGMVTLINVTMVGALMSLAGNIPDRPLLQILSRYLRKKDEPPEIMLYPWEAASRLARLRKKILVACVVTAMLGVGLSIWSLTVGWGSVALLAITGWVVAGNLLFDSLPLAVWRRRTLLMDIEEEEKDRK